MLNSADAAHDGQISRAEALVTCKSSARSLFSLCESKEDLSRTERLLRQKICECAETAAQRFDGAPCPDDRQDRSIWRGGAVYCPLTRRRRPPEPTNENEEDPWTSSRYTISYSNPMLESDAWWARVSSSA